MITIYYLDYHNNFSKIVSDEKVIYYIDDWKNFDGSYFNNHNQIFKIHNDSGPAFIDQNRSRIEYFINGFNHRLDGPSVIGPIIKNYYIKGIQLDPYLFAIKTNHLICKKCKNFCQQYCFL